MTVSAAPSQKCSGQIKASSMPDLPLFWTEWNVQGMDESRDTTFVGPALANTVRECDGNVTLMSFWTFSDVFEEGGPIPKPFEGQFGLRAKGGINKPSYYGFALLHQLGDQRLANPSKNVIVTTNACWRPGDRRMEPGRPRTAWRIRGRWNSSFKVYLATQM